MCSWSCSPPVPEGIPKPVSAKGWLLLSGALLPNQLGVPRSLLAPTRLRDIGCVLWAVLLLPVAISACASAARHAQVMEKAKVFEQQNDFAAKIDRGDGPVVPFTTILDKGYRVTLMAWHNGKQMVYQPFFSHSDCCFCTAETISSGSTASDRSGNERGVKVCKLSAKLKRGFHPRGNPSTFNDIWLCWSFQTNFMFGSVL